MQIPSERLIGQAGSEDAEKVLVCIGGMHGNEPAGVIAIQSVFSVLAKLDINPSTRIIGLKGNISALAHRVRFMNRDLNRMWREEDEPISDHILEKREYEELKAILTYLAETHEEFSLVDLHTTSAESVPFIWDQYGKNIIRNDSPVPVVEDFMIQVGGTLAGYFSRRGFPILSAEGGQHHSEEAPQNLADIIWLVLEILGAVEHHVIFSQARHRLEQIVGDVPKALKIFHHHRLTAEDEFKMQPGFSNFQEVEEGTLLAYDRNGAITAPKKCRVLLPLYQEQGEDGFLLIEENE